MKGLQRSLELALNQEWPQLTSTQTRLAKFKPVRIEHLRSSASKVPVIATVATDGGENKLSLEPIRLQIIRVADSQGEIYFEDFVANSLRPNEILRFFFQSNERLQEFMEVLELKWSELLPATPYQKANLLSMLRELMEWAALLKLAASPPRKLLIRDGLLRSILLSNLLFDRLLKKFEQLCNHHGHLLAGVAKRSGVLNYLSLAFGINESFSGAEPAYLEIPRDLEMEAAPPQYRWADDRSMGNLHVARLDHGNSIPLIPVDIANWQKERVAEAMSLLHHSAKASFPIRGYPQPLVRAHENAHLGGFEMEMLEALLLESIENRDSNVSKTARRLMLLGKQFSSPLKSPHEI